MSAPRAIQARLLADDRRLYLNDGPIDLVIEAVGEPTEVRAAYAQAVAAFGGLLDGLCAELRRLRAPLGEEKPVFAGPIARRMLEACWPLRADFITPMAAVAGALADHMCQHLCAGRNLARAYVNDGGDIAFHLAPGENLTCGLICDLAVPGIDATVALGSDMKVRGIATSGWAHKGTGGRSFSLGIADAVTVLAADAAAADAAATIVANAVDLPGHAAIARRPAIELDPDSDLGTRAVTTGVGALDPQEIAAALAAGVAKARALRRAGLIHGAVLVLRQRYGAVGVGRAIAARDTA
mgnify:CR=1 FL=1